MVTWPISAPVYGAIWLLSVVATSNAINKFTDNYWFVISLRFLNGKVLAMPESEHQSPTPYANPKMDPGNPVVQHADAATETDLINPSSNVGVSSDSILPRPRDPWKDSRFSACNDATTLDYVASTLEEARLLDVDCLDMRILAKRRSRHACTYELWSACHPKESAADARVFERRAAANPEKFEIWCFLENLAPWWDGSDYIFGKLSQMDRMNQVELVEYLTGGKHGPMFRKICLPRLIECDKSKEKFWKKYEEIDDALPGEIEGFLFNGNYEPTDMFWVFPPSFVVYLLKAEPQKLNLVIRSMTMDNEADVWHALHVLQGLPIIEVV
ncbi:MAG: hypothetical protein LBD72_01695, partial [Puniceicoccales bacterium]|nr:hypothetical protein [Puniceicoccales bacterium]